jgi:hypothetical protein
VNIQHRLLGTTDTETAALTASTASWRKKAAEPANTLSTVFDTLGRRPEKMRRNVYAVIFKRTLGEGYPFIISSQRGRLMTALWFVCITTSLWTRKKPALRRMLRKYEPHTYVLAKYYPPKQNKARPTKLRSSPTTARAFDSWTTRTQVFLDIRLPPRPAGIRWFLWAAPLVGRRSHYQFLRTCKPFPPSLAPPALIITPCRLSAPT